MGMPLCRLCRGSLELFTGVPWSRAPGQEPVRKESLSLLIPSGTEVAKSRQDVPAPSPVPQADTVHDILMFNGDRASESFLTPPPGERFTWRSGPDTQDEFIFHTCPGNLQFKTDSWTQINL